MTSPALYREFTMQAQIDAQYNPATRVADAGVFLRRYVEASRQARKQLKAVTDLRYGPTLAETLDIFPADVAGAPVFVFLHGGYWRAFSSREFSFVASGLQPLGITTVVVNYALAPQVSLDEIARQARAAVAWVLRRIDRHGGDPTRVAVGGHSAGGQLSALCLLTRWAEDYGLPADPLAAGVLVSGLHDLEPLRYSYLQPQIQLDDGIVRRNSPLRHVRPCVTPALIAWGGAESAEFERQSSEFDAAWQAAGNRSERLAVPGCNHYDVIQGFEDPASGLCQWLARTLQAPATR